jgi:7-cyano-7-deazaguanine synthase in queuosine biosynthesis
MKSKLKRAKRAFVPEQPSEKIAAQFGSIAGLNAISVGSSVFQFEQALRARRIRRLVVPIYGLDRGQYDLERLGRLLHELIVFTLVEDVEIEFRELRWEGGEQLELLDIGRMENVCLFSGGVDSYAGLLLSHKVLKTVEGVFCAHTDQARIIHIVADIQRRIMGPLGIKISKVSVPSISARGYAQLRGFLYLLSAGAFADKLCAQRIIVTECGPTMYQPRFSPLDSVTMTTHPFVVRKAQEVVSLLLKRDVKVIIPFENLTKAEVVAICPLKEGLKYTHSCISQRFGVHDGTCYGCVIRRLATTAAGVEDVKYNKNPISDSNASAGNLYSLLSFCAGILTQYDRMEEFEIGTIDVYHKRNLFRRFALDNFAAILRLISENKRVQRPIRDMYNSVAKKLRKGTLEDRLAELAHPSVRPNFSKVAI